MTVARPIKQGGRVPDFTATIGERQLVVEVKAPYKPMPVSSGWWGNGSELLAQTLDEGNRQFASGRANVLVIVTNASNRFFGSRDDLVRAFIGEDLYQIVLNKQTGETIREGTVFSTDGK